MAPIGPGNGLSSVLQTSHCPNRSWLIVNRTHQNNLQWNYSKNIIISNPKNTFENVIGKMWAIFFPVVKALMIIVSYNLSAPHDTGIMNHHLKPFRFECSSSYTRRIKLKNINLYNNCNWYCVWHSSDRMRRAQMRYHHIIWLIFTGQLIH